MRYGLYRTENGYRELVAYEVGPKMQDAKNADMIASFHVHNSYQEADAKKYATMFADYLNTLEEVKDKAAETIKLGAK